MKLVEHFRTLRKAQLQEYFVRWFPREQVTSDKEKLVEQLRVAMCDPKTIRGRFDRLPRSSQDFLVSLLTRPDYSGTVEEVRSTPRGRSIEPYEVESLLKNLTSEGWVVPVSEASNGVRREVYVLPEEIGEGLGVTVDVEFRDPAAMLSLEAFLEEQGGDAPPLETLTEIDGVRDRIAALPDPSLRETVQDALSSHGGILPVSRWHEEESDGGENGAGRLHRADWRRHLEESYLGTTGVLSLKLHGIELEEECLVVFQEIVESHCRDLLAREPEANDTEYSIGADLLIDIRRLLEIARSEALEITREGSVFRKTEEKLESQLLTNHYAKLFEDTPLHHILGLCKRLRILDQGDRYLRPDPMRRRLWTKKRLPAMVKSIYDLYSSECRGAHWSFHQRIIRTVFLEEFKALTPGRWHNARALFALVVARYLRDLEANGVAGTFRDLQMEEFHSETLMVPLERLHQDLSYWVVHRLALAGLVNLGCREGQFNSLQLSSLGCRLFKVDPGPVEDGKLVINPDFEILLFPGSQQADEASYTISAFADRTASDWVKRYRITPDSVRRGVISGFTAESILEFLESSSSAPVPSNVAYSIREWAEGIEPVLRQRVLLLKTQTERGADQVGQILEKQEIPHERVGELAIVVRGVKNERRIRELQQIFQNAGLILE